MSSNRIMGMILLSAVLSITIAGISFARTDHREYKDSKPQDCRDCHHESGVTDNHGALFLKEHRLLAYKAGGNCWDCHQQSYCLDCHKGGNIDANLTMIPSSKGDYMPQTHRSDFISIHAIKAKDDPQNCYRCHDSATFCNDCHNNIQNRGGMQVRGHSTVGNSKRYFLTRTSSPADIAAHAAEARRNLQSCEGCHPDAVVCTQCHNFSAGGKTFSLRAK